MISNDQKPQIYCVGSPAGDLGERCRHAISESHSREALQLIDSLSKKRLGDINSTHLSLLVYRCLCLTCQLHQYEQISYAWAKAIEASARHQGYLMTAFEGIHTAACSSLVAQLDTERDLAGKFKEQQSADQEAFALRQDALEISKKNAKRQEERVHFLEMENFSLRGRLEEELAASYEHSLVNRSLEGKVNAANSHLLLVQAEVNELRNENAFQLGNTERLLRQNDALENHLETARWESERLRDSETALAQRLKCQRHDLQKLEWKMQDRTTLEQGLKKLEVILKAVEKDVTELVAQRELELDAEQELEQQLMMEREEHHDERRQHQRERRKERARNSALVKRVRALELLGVEMKEEMEGNWMYWIWKGIKDPRSLFRHSG